MASVRGASFLFLSIKAERVASEGVRCLQSLHKDNAKFSEISKSTAISRGRLERYRLSGVYDVGTSIAKPQVSRLNMGTDVGVRFDLYPHTDFFAKVLRNQLRNSGTHLRGIVRRVRPIGVGSLEEISPLLGCGLCQRWIEGRDRHGRAIATLRYGRKICHRNFPNKALFKKVHDSAKNIIHSQKWCISGHGNRTSY